MIFIGHNRTQNLAVQRRVAREQVARKLRIYNEKIQIGPVFGKYLSIHKSNFTKPPKWTCTSQRYVVRIR